MTVDAAPEDTAGGHVVAVTGAAGLVGGMLRPRLSRPGRTLRLIDLRTPAEPLTAGEEFVRASVTDPDAMAAAMAGVDTVVHLGGLSGEDRWDRIIDVNVRGTNTLFEAARTAGVRRIVYASSNHAVGYHRQEPSTVLPDHLVPRPDSFYGASKAFGEALGSLYHDRYGLHVVCVRIGSCFDRPRNARMLETWLSPDDAGRLFEAALSAEGFHVVWGVSDNAERQWSLDAARALGYRPADDASRVAGPDVARDVAHPVSVYVGGDDMPTYAG
ncbi:NAD-dependent epimerase/dehydratase family protein [Nakamurella endophytica]|uniref:NAD-dependent dehydratase n=1 Tax=Nakamurella endophytica TaxID=1748367 RepID=A0A917STS3_9ACTN|nr:NAD(P)-dependent oxidoreductase [Nakamurella endophytica]GGL98649.1 NAD-dependent dehydratase [Nakamurella endophytica]